MPAPAPLQAGMLTSWGQAGAYIASELADLGQDPSEEDRQTWAYVAYAMSGVTAVLLLWTLVMVPRLKARLGASGVGRRWWAQVGSEGFQQRELLP